MSEPGNPSNPHGIKIRTFKPGSSKGVVTRNKAVQKPSEESDNVEFSNLD
jgi:hypothetical protein